MAAKHKLASGAMDGLLKACSTTKRHSPRPPLRKTDELADELGVPKGHLAALLRREGAPLVRLVRVVHRNEIHYFGRAEVLRWYRTISAPRTPTEPPAAA